MTPGRLGAAIALIDAANAGDPNTVVVGGVARPKEQVHAELMTAWVTRLDPDASDEQLLAARAHHLRRWSVPRASYPDGRAGYLRWRARLRAQHADEVAALLARAGYGAKEVARVQAIVRKEGLGRSGAADPAVQVHEDALCLVFLQTQAADLAADLGADKAADVLRKTVAKMSAAGVAAALALDVDPAVRALLAAATAPPAPARFPATTTEEPPT